MFSTAFHFKTRFSHKSSHLVEMDAVFTITGDRYGYNFNYPTIDNHHNNNNSNGLDLICAADCFDTNQLQPESPFSERRFTTKTRFSPFSPVQNSFTLPVPEMNPLLCSVLDFDIHKRCFQKIHRDLHCVTWSWRFASFVCIRFEFIPPLFRTFIFGHLLLSTLFFLIFQRSERERKKGLEDGRWAFPYDRDVQIESIVIEHCRSINSYLSMKES